MDPARAKQQPERLWGIRKPELPWYCGCRPHESRRGLLSRTPVHLAEAPWRPL